VQKKKRILLLRREMERARAGGGDGQGGFLRRLVNSVVRPGQSRTPAELILSLQAEVGPSSLAIRIASGRFQADAVGRQTMIAACFVTFCDKLKRMQHGTVTVVRL